MSTMMFSLGDTEPLSASVTLLYIFLVLPPDLLLLLSDLLQLHLQALAQPHEVILHCHTVVQV